jgi:tRNA(Ile)-lysidine synthase
LRAVKAAGHLPAWPECAARLAALIPRSRLDVSVVRWADRATLRSAWSVAFSGGADSLALLLLIWAHWPERRRNLRVLHFNHRLRGAESRADVTFCRRVSRALGVTFVSDSWTDPHPRASEAEARAARMAFLETNGRAVWFGHQQDDVAESVLMRLARGSGTGGLAAPRPVQIHPAGRVHLRPLLGLKKIEIIAALQQVRAIWRDDSTNAGDRFFRNRIREQVVPLWVEAAQRDAIAGAARSRALLEEDDVALEAWLAETNPFRRRGVLALTALAGKPRALLRRALHRWLLKQPHAGDLSRQAFDALLDAIEAGKATRHSVGREGFAVTNGRELVFERVRNKRRNFHGPAN